MPRVPAIVLETLLVGVAGLTFALAANALSPRGLSLTRNYFPDVGRDAVTTTDRTGSGSANPNRSTASSSVAQRLQQRGLQLATSEDAISLFRDARREQGLIVFIDARNEEHYAKGHIPGAWLFDRYRLEQYLATILPLCLVAQHVVVYCTGGECDDSEMAALTLRDAGVLRENLSIYAGGITDWSNRGWPIETGARGSGEIQPSKP